MTTATIRLKRRAVVFTSEGAPGATVKFDAWLAEHPNAELLHVVPTMAPIQYSRGSHLIETVHATRYALLVVYAEEALDEDGGSHG